MTKAAKRAAIYWDAYCKETEPMKRKWYGRLYEMWADLRDREAKVLPDTQPKLPPQS